MKKESKTQIYGCSLEAKHTQFAFEDPQILQMTTLIILLQSSVSHILSEIILIFEFAAFLIIIYVDVVLLNIFVETMMHFFQDCGLIVISNINLL